ncbi:MAG: hypothetical protein LN410_04580 [Candidatus Thermoplasmatota archaeon]|nr:hypothetical protein [Candidatus Thermoplasmatota archaeon]
MGGRTRAFVTVDRVASSLKGVDHLLSHRRRRRLAEAILLDVLQAVRDSRLVDETVLVTQDPAASALGQNTGIPIRALPVRQANEAFHGESAGAVALLRGDLVLLEAQDLAFLFGRVAQGAGLLLVPTTGSDGLSLVLGSGTDALIADFEGGTLASWEEAAEQGGLTPEIYAIPAGRRPSGPMDLLAVYTAARPSRAKGLLKDWRVGQKLRRLGGEEP